MKKQDVQQPSIANMTETNRQLFTTAGSDVPPVHFEQNPIFFEKEIENLQKTLSRDAEWDIRVKAMRRLMGLINAGVLENDYFRKNLITFYSDISTAITNLRSALVKQSCLLVSQLSRELGTQFESIGDYFIPLSSQLSHGTQIISESCYFTILNIARNCPSKRILFSIFDLSGVNTNNVVNAGSKRRGVAAECLKIVVENWDFSIIESNWDVFQKAVLSLISDSSAEAREQSRQIVRLLMNIAPKRANQILSQLDERTKKNINSEPLKQETAVKYSSYKPKRQPPTDKTNSSEIPDQEDTSIPKKGNQNAKSFLNDDKLKNEANSIQQDNFHSDKNQLKETKIPINKEKPKPINNSLPDEASNITSNEKVTQLKKPIKKLKQDISPNEIDKNENEALIPEEFKNQHEIPTSYLTTNQGSKLNSKIQNAKSYVNDNQGNNNDEVQPNQNDRIIQTAKSSRNQKNLLNDSDVKPNKKPNPVIYRPISQKDKTELKNNKIKVNPSQPKIISTNNNIINDEPLANDTPVFEQKNEKKRSMMPVFKPKTPVPSAQKVETEEYYHPHPPSTADSSQALRQRNYQRYKPIEVKKIKRSNPPPTEKPELSFGPATDPNRQQYAVSHEYDHPPHQKVKPKAEGSKQKKPKSYTVVDLSEGNEMEFLESVENVYQQKKDNLVPKLPTITAGILNCLTSQKSNQKIKDFAFLVLDHIVDSFPTIFSLQILPKILPLIISDQDGNLNIISILSNFSKNYKNDLLPIALQMNANKAKPTYYLFLLNSILENSNLQNFDQNDFVSILNIAMNCINSQVGKDDSKRLVKSIIKKINSDILSQFLDSYEQSVTSFNRNEFENLYVNELQIPKYNQNRASFRKAVLDAVTDNESDLVWNECQEDIYKQLALSLKNQSSNSKILKDNILIVKTIIEERGIDSPKNKIGFEVIIEEMFNQISIGNGNETLFKSIFTFLASHTSFTSICSLLTKVFLSNKEITEDSAHLWINGLHLLAESIISSESNADILPQFEQMMPFLKNGVESSNVAIRQMSFQCFVNLKLVVDAKSDVFIFQLSDQHQKLISIMYNRSK